MIKHLMFVLALAGCTKASTANETSNNGPAAAPRTKATVTLTSVTLADNCGGTPPAHAPIIPARVAHSEAVAPAKERADTAARRRCEQTSMQLAIAATADTDVRIKSVEVFDERGSSVGVLSASKPTRWIDARSVYEAWDEKVAAGETARASYVLSQPQYLNRYDSHDRTYTVKVVASVGGLDQPLQTAVMIVARPAPAPT